MYLSVVIPAFNEMNRLESTVAEVSRFLDAGKYEFEIIIVDDGSNDETFSVANGLADKSSFRVTVLRNDMNRGKGFSVKRGIQASRGKFILFSDADLSTPIEELDKFFPCIEEGYDIVIGSRAKKNSDVRKRQPWHRQMMGKAFNLFVKLLLFDDFNDTQCGFKLFKADTAREISQDLRLDGFCFDVEMIYIAKEKGYRIKDVGVVWNDSPRSKVHIMKSSISMFFDLFRIRKLHG